MGVSRCTAHCCRVLVLLGLTAGVTLAAKAALPAPNPMQVEAGRKVYREYCASCHGHRGEGQANWEVLDAQGELPAPPHNGEGHTWKHADAMLYRMVSEGWRDPFNKTRRLTMPPFRDQLSPEQIRNVITYLKTLWTPEQRQFQGEETRVRGPFPPSRPAAPSQPDGRKDSDDLR
ncbi:MAG: cytochrome c [Rhodospirillales bacterium]|nr:cytochrome c [Rhodospirillales bacterium]